MKTITAGLLVVPLLIALNASPAAQANRPWCAQYSALAALQIAASPPISDA
jgi:hypothetical protein